MAMFTRSVVTHWLNELSSAGNGLSDVFSSNFWYKKTCPI